MCNGKLLTFKTGPPCMLGRRLSLYTKAINLSLTGITIKNKTELN